jgi:anthranilate phosphoribosyltransferase
VRREIGIRTVFNILGPLANPAGVRRYLLGVPSAALGETVARALLELGVERALVVHGTDGLDEISPSAETRTWEVSPGGVREGTLEPKSLGLKTAPRSDIVGGDAAKNADAARSVLEGSAGGARTAVLMNAGAACWVAGLAGTVREGVDVASRAIDNGAARTALVRFAAKSQLIGAAETAAV